MADTDQPKAELVVETRVDGAIKPFDQVVEAAQKMGRKVGEAADTAAKGVDGIGAGAAAGADRMDKATRSIAASIQRSIAVTKAGERGTADFYTALADVKGIDKKALAPYIEQLRQVEIAQKASITSLSNMGLTAKQTKAALQQVPAQFTDIITSLQGGQAPMTVLLQQGGQLKDVFGGVGAAAKALGGYILGLVNPYTVAAAAAAGLAAAYTFGANEAQSFQRTIILSGQLAGVTAGQLSDMAMAIRAVGAGSQGRASEVLAKMASDGLVAAGSLERFTAAAVGLERVGGPAAEETAKAFADLGREPLKAAIKLNETTGFMTRSIYEQIKALEDQGRHVEAARVAQEAYDASVRELTPKLEANLGRVERAWLAIKTASKKALDDVLDVGRQDGPATEMANLRRRIELTKAGNFDRSELPALQERLALLEKTAKADAARAAAVGEQARQVKLLADYRKDDEQYLSRNEKTTREITRAIVEGVAAGEKMEAIQARVAVIRERGRDKSNSGNKELEAEIDLMAKLSGLTTTYNNDIQRLNNLRSRGVLSEERYAKAVQELVAAQPYMVRYTRELTEAERARNKELDDAAKARDRYAEGIEASIAGAAKETQSLQDQLVQLSMGKEALNERIALRLEDQALAADSAARWTAVTEIEAEGYRRLAEQLRATARARRELTQGQIEKDLLDANKKAADRALREWERAADQIGANLADALIEGGDSAAKYIERLFKNMVLQPIVQAAIQPFVNAGIGAIGGGASGLGSTVGTAAGLGSLGAFGAFGTAFGMGSALTGAGGIGTALGASGNMIAAGNYAGGFGMGAGALAGPAAIAAIYANVASSAYDDGFRRNQARNVINPAGGALLGGIGGLYGSLSADVATGLSKLGLSDKWADILSGATAWAKTFGRAAPKVTNQGISGSIGAGDFTGSAFADIVEKGGIFRSDKKYTKTSALPEEIGRMLDESAKSLLDKAQDYGAALGLPVESLGNLSKNIKIVLGKDAAANQEAILASLSTYGDTLVAAWADALKPVAEYGETTAETVSRVAESLTVINAVLKQLGLTSLEASVTGGKAAVELGNAFGGLDALQQSSKSYYESFYSDSERAAKATQSVTEALAAVGLALPSTKDQFRDLVEAADLTTEAGRTQYATLLGVADVFSQITDSGKDLIKAGEGVAEYIAELRGASTKGGSLAAARATYATDLASAKAGDVSATSRIVSDAKALVEAVRQAATDPIALARETSRIAAELQSLPAMQAYLSQVPAASAAQPTPQASVSPSASVAQSSQQASSFSVDSIVTELKANRTAIETVALNTGKTVKILDRLTVDGNAIEWVST